jgi:hypothetical protein
MPSFSRNDLEAGRRDWQLLQNGFVHLFHDVAVLRTTLDWLDAAGYHAVSLDAGSWSLESDMHSALAAAFEFPDYYGRNIDALNDCLGDVALYAYGTRPTATGTILVLTRFDSFAARDRPVARMLLDTWAGAARLGALIGHRMICLAQSGDPAFHIAPVGSQPVMWNPEEWLESKRLGQERKAPSSRTDAVPAGAPFPCPCCGFAQLSERPPGTYEICGLCGWEDDPVQFNDPMYRGGANKQSLVEYRLAFFASPQGADWVKRSLGHRYS